MKPVAVALLAFSLTVLALAAAARAAWVVDDDGRCVETWSPAAMARGPRAIADAPLVPVRYGAGAAQELRQAAPRGFTGDSAFFRILYAPLAFVAALVDGFTRASFGLADTVTGGAVHIGDDDPAQFTAEATPLGVLGPLPQAPLEPYPLDPCDREVYPLAVSNDAEL